MAPSTPPNPLATEPGTVHGPQAGALALRRVTAADAEATAALMAAPEVQANTLQLPHAHPERWRSRLQELAAPGKPDIMLLAERPGADGRPEVVGMAGLHAVGEALRRRHAMSLGISVAGPAQGQGVGTRLMQALVDYADHWAQVLRLELTVFADNAAAIRLYQRFGFEREGLHRGYALRGGRYADVLSMARLHPSPPTWG